MITILSAQFTYYEIIDFVLINFIFDKNKIIVESGTVISVLFERFGDFGNAFFESKRYEITA